MISHSDEEPYDQFEVTLADDVSSWNAGDKLVIASTDFNMNQAEEVEVVSTEGNNLVFKGTVFIQLLAATHIVLKIPQIYIFVHYICFVSR